MESLFPFHVIDYDTKRGYDALLSRQTPQDLSRESMCLIEFKYMLGAEFKYACNHLAAVVCWNCNLSEGTEVSDTENKRRELRNTEQVNWTDYIRYMLVSSAERHSIEVFVLKDFLREKLDMEFRPRRRAS